MTAVGNSTRRGFTFHEHLDNLSLIHMNGRVYDPATGRFISADPFVQAPFNLQSLNRYSYVFNDPLSYTDPSGFEGIRDSVTIWAGGATYYGQRGRDPYYQQPYTGADRPKFPRNGDGPENPTPTPQPQTPALGAPDDTVASYPLVDWYSEYLRLALLNALGAAGSQEKVDVFSAEISLGAQVQYDVRLGPVVTLNGVIDLGSYRQSTSSVKSVVTQEFGGGITFFERVHLGASTSRATPQKRLISQLPDVVTIIPESLEGVLYTPTDYSISTASRASVDQSIGGGDLTIVLGAAVGVGVELTINLSETGRRIVRWSLE